ALNLPSRSNAMNAWFRRQLTLVEILGILLILAPGARAELVRVEITSRVDVANGKSWGSAGPYEKIRGRAHFVVDPAHPRNQVIADIDLAPRNAQGKVEFSSDLFILKPK